MSRLRSALYAALICAIGVPHLASAQNTSALRQAIDTVPAIAFQQDKPLIAAIYNIRDSEAIGLIGPSGIAPLLERWTASGNMVLTAFASSDPGRWRTLTGLDLSEPEGFSVYELPAGNVTVWTMRDNAKAEGFFYGLSRSRFRSGDYSGTVTYKGAPSDPTGQEANPFVNSVGEPATLAIANRYVVQSAQREVLATAIKTFSGNGLAENEPVVNTALKALENLTKDARIPQALILSPAIGGKSIAVFDTTEQIGGGRSSPLLSAYSAIILADLQLKDGRRGAAFSFTYRDCTFASNAAKILSDRVKSLEDLKKALGTVQMQGDIKVIKAGSGCAAVLTMLTPAPADKSAQNPIYLFFSFAVFTNNIPFLKIG